MALPPVALSSLSMCPVLRGQGDLQPGCSAGCVHLLPGHREKVLQRDLHFAVEEWGAFCGLLDFRDTE